MEKKTVPVTFKDYYGSLSDSEKKIVREKYLGESGVSVPTFYFKVRNESFSPLEIQALERICQMSFFNK